MSIQESISTELPGDLPKPELEEPKAKMNVWLKSVSSLALYLVIGYFYSLSNGRRKRAAYDAPDIVGFKNFRRDGGVHDCM
jgi:hypothetical protein